MNNQAPDSPPPHDDQVEIHEGTSSNPVSLEHDSMPDDVLIVSENSTANQAMAAAIAADGTTIHTATDSSQAIEIVADLRPRAVLMDMSFITRSLIIDAVRRQVASRETAVLMIEMGDGESTQQRAFSNAAMSACKKEPADKGALTPCLHEGRVQRKSGFQVAEVHAKTPQAKDLAHRIRCLLDHKKTTVDEKDADESVQMLHLREPRYSVTKQQKIDASIAIGLEGERFELPVNVIDLSRDGAKIQCKLHISAATPITLSLKVRRRNISLTISGEVKWCQLNTDDTCRIGCSFFVEVPSDVIQQLAELGYLERRGDARKSVDFDVSVKQELTSTPPVEGQIIDYSSSGLRLSLPSPVKLHGRLLLEPAIDDDDAPVVPVRALWQRTQDGRCEVGCCFLSTSGRDVIRGLDSKNHKPVRRLMKRKTAALRLSPTWAIGLLTVMSLTALRLIDPWDWFVIQDTLQNEGVFQQVQHTIREIYTNLFG